MQKIFFEPRRLLALASVALLLGACTSGAEIRTSKDPAADFAGFRTFGFMQPLSTDRNGARTRLSGHLIAATTRELKAHGLVSVSSNPDLVVNFYSGMSTGIQGQVGTPITPAVRNYGGWAGYPLGAFTSNSISEGTIVVDIVDRRSNRLVWEGRYHDRLTEAMKDDLGRTVSDAIVELFAEFP